jgi:hypothetical protein
MSAPTGNFRGQRTQSSSNGYKTIGSSIASGSNGGCFKRIFINALGNTNGNYDLAFTKTLGIPRHYYNSTSNNSNYQQPSLSGKTRQVVTVPTAISLTQVSQSATVATPITYSYYMKKLDELSCLTEVFKTTPQGLSITTYEIDLTNFYTYLSGNITNLSTSTIALYLLPYNNINYFFLTSTTIEPYLNIYVNTGQNYNSSYTNYLVLGVEQDQTVINNGSINIYKNGFLTNYFYYTPPDNSISIQNQSSINLLPSSIWYKLGIANIQNGSINGSYTSSLPTSPSPPW